jgi:hypothetical protein
MVIIEVTITKSKILIIIKIERKVEILIIITVRERIIIIVSNQMFQNLNIMHQRFHTKCRKFNQIMLLDQRLLFLQEI